jgi:hypothetical protein
MEELREELLLGKKGPEEFGFLFLLPASSGPLLYELELGRLLKWSGETL